MDPKQKLSLNANHSGNWNEVYERISWWDSQKVAQAKVMVVGAGALGNEVLKNLALLNIGYILIVDFDEIEYSNLSRSVLFRESDCGKSKAEVAAERIRDMNPNVYVECLHGDIAFDVGLGIFRRLDVIIGCLDNRVARLYINRHSYKMGKTWVDGAIENLAGQLNVFRPNVACYECQLKDEEWKAIQYREGCTDVARRNANFGRIPTTPISASVIGALQTQEALKVINDNSGQSIAGKRFFYDGMHNEFLCYNAPPLKEYCTSHVFYDPVTEAPELSYRMQVAEALGWLESHLGTTEAKILLDYDIVLELCGEESEAISQVTLPRFRLSDETIRHYQHVPGEAVMITQATSCLDRTFIGQDMTLQQTGIPPLHILTVETEGNIHFIELSGDCDVLQLENPSVRNEG